MPLFDSVLHERDGKYEFVPDVWDRAADDHTPVGKCSRCSAPLYASRRAEVPEYGHAVYREMECLHGHEFHAVGRTYPTAPIRQVVYVDHTEVSRDD